MRYLRYLVMPAVLLALVGLAGLAGQLGAAGTVKAPDFAGGGPWFNSGGKALTLTDLRGKVIAVEMWTGGCINCINTLSSVKSWDAKYRAKGLIIVGVHTPEFKHEHSQQFVQDRIAHFGLKYPVVMDNDYRIWDAYKNVYWPTLYLIDKKGFIRYKHIGEGEYTATEQTIARLLAEPN